MKCEQYGISASPGGSAQRHVVWAMRGLLLAIAGFQTAHAATYTWTQNSAATQTWTSTANWQSGTAASSPGSTTDAIVFFSNTTTNLAAGTNAITTSVPNLTLNSLTLNGLGPSATGTTSVVIGTNSTTWTLDGTNPSVNLNGGSPASSRALSYAVAVNLALGQANTAFTGNGSGAFDFTGVISGANAAITKSGASTLNLSGSNTYGGGTTLSGGMLNINDAGALGTGALTITGGTINCTRSAGGITVSNSQNWNGDFGYRGTRTLGIAGPVTLGKSLSLDTTANTLTVDGAIGESGSGFGITKTGSGTLILNGTNTFSGGVTLNGGMLRLGSTQALGTGTLTIMSGTLDSRVSGLINANNNVQNWNGDFTFAAAQNLTLGTGAVTLGKNVAVTVQIGASGSRLTVGGAIGDSGAGYGLTKSGSGTLVLNGANTFGGATLVVGGTLSLGNANALANSTLDTGAAGSQIVTFTASGTNTYALGGLAGSDDLAIGANSISVGGNNASTTFGGSLGGIGGLFKVGSGTLTLSGASTYSGETRVNAGTLVIGAANAISSSSAITLGSASSRGNLEIDHAFTISSLTFTGSGGDVVMASTGTATFFAASGSATINVLSGSNYFHANATLSSPTVVDVANGAFFSFHNNLFGDGSASLTKSGSGTMELAGDNDQLQGNLFVTGGRVNIGAGMNQIGTGTTTLSNGATIDLGGQSFTDRIVVLSGTILNAGGTATTTTIQGVSTISGTTAQGTYNIASSGSALFNVAVGSGTSTVNVNVNSGAGNGGQASFASAVGAKGNIVVYAGGTATFSSTVAGAVTSHGASTFNGNLLSGANAEVRDGGSSIFAASTAAGSTVSADSGGSASFFGTVAGQATINGSATFSTASGLTGLLYTGATGSALLDNVATTMTGTIHNDGSLTVNRTSGRQTISALISGSGILLKQGAGTLVLTGSNTYTGNTVITGSGSILALGAGGSLANSRTIVVGNADSTGAVLDLTAQGGANKTFTFNADQKLMGKGTIDLDGATLRVLGTLAPGNSPGNLTINGNLAWQATDAGYQWEINNATGVAGTNWDLITVTGVLNLSALSATNKYLLDLTTLTSSNTAGLMANYVDGDSYTWSLVSASSVLLASGTATAGADITDLFTLSFANWGNAKPSARNYSVKVASDGAGINLVIIPEPDTIIFAGIGIAMAGWSLWKRRRIAHMLRRPAP